MRTARLGQVVAVAVVTAVTACTSTASPPAAEPSMPSAPAAPGNGPRYVAMGDSAAAAPLVPDAGTPAGCFKSTNNYPSVLARTIGAASFTDVTCSGATTADLVSRPQRISSGTVPPQLDAVTTDTELVTITIGGNDVELSSLAAGCRRTALDARPCSAELVDGGVDSVSTEIDSRAAEWAELIDAVKTKAPGARIVLVGYGTYVRPDGCFPDEPINPVDAAYFHAKLDELDDRQQSVAAEKDIEYFDPRPMSVGHDVCAAPSERYFEGFVVRSPAAPLHPNGRGASAFGAALADYVS